jgi:cell wall-associated NlpC family hydrolase
MHWANQYVGLPWVLAGRARMGVDCWGLLWLVYAEVLGIRLSSYSAETVDGPEREEIAGMIRGEQGRICWHPVEAGLERDFDMVVLKRAGIESHIGLVTGPGQMIHIVDGADALIERFDQGRWKMKVAGIYRHDAMQGRVNAA